MTAECESCRSLDGSRLTFSAAAVLTRCVLLPGSRHCESCRQTLGGEIDFRSSWSTDADREALLDLCTAAQLARIGRDIWDVGANGSGPRSCWGLWLQDLERDWSALADAYARRQVAVVALELRERSPVARAEVPAIISALCSPWLCPRCDRDWPAVVRDRSGCPRCPRDQEAATTRARFAYVRAELERPVAAVTCARCDHDIALHHLPGMTCDHRERELCGFAAPRCGCSGFVAPALDVPGLEVRHGK